MLCNECCDEGFHSIAGSVEALGRKAERSHDDLDLITLNRLCESLHCLSKLRREEVVSESFFSLLAWREVLDQGGPHLWMLVDQLKESIRLEDA